MRHETIVSSVHSMLLVVFPIIIYYYIIQHQHLSVPRSKNSALDLLGFQLIKHQNRYCA